MDSSSRQSGEDTSMAMPLTCPRGHAWDPDGHDSSSPPSACPVCGLAFQPATVIIAPTLEFQPEPQELDRAPDETSGDRATVPRAPGDTSFVVSQHIPGYEILGELGRGGMGVVYKAKQKSLNRTVALKMILAGTQAEPAQLERFRAEAAAIARLQHPFIVQIYEIGDYMGCPFFSLEYVNGGTLAQKLNGAPQPPRLAAHMVRLLAVAMHSAHQKGIIHRDLKPGNVLLATLAEHNSGPDSFEAEMQAAFRLYGIPKITDFGLAKHLDVQSTTRTGAIIGTPTYMAPEQAEGRTHAIGPATDVYNLGLILYEMLTGRPPFEGDSSLNTIRKLLTQEPTPPSQLHRKVPRDLETICLKCLEKDPGRRYASAEDLAEDLHRFLSDRPIEARPTGWWGRAVKWTRRHPTRAALAGTIALACLILLTLGLAYHFRLAGALEQVKQSAEESRQNLIRLHVGQGTSAMNAGDGFTAMLWFTEALRLDAGTEEHEQPHRQRIAALERGLPRPEQLWVHDGAVNEVSFSPEGKRVLTAGDDGKLHVWDSDTGDAVFAPLDCGSLVVRALFSHDGKRIATATRAGTARVWDAGDGHALTPPLSHGGALRWIDFSPDGKQVVTAGVGTAARVWDVASGQQLPGELKHSSDLNVALFSPDGRWLATAGDDGLVHLWDAVKRRDTSVVLPHDRAVLCLAFDRDSKRLASGSADRTAQVWDVATGAPVGRRVRHRDRVTHVTFSPMGHRLLTCGEDGQANIWRVADSERLVEPLRHTSAIRWAEFSPDGCRVATAGDDNSARLWSANNGTPLTPPLRHNGSLNRVTFSPDSRRLATAGDDGTVRVWDAACRRQSHIINEDAVFRYHVDRDLRVSLNDRRLDKPANPISPDGTLVVKINPDNTARVYRVADDKPVSPPLKHRGEITHAAFSSDGHFVVTTSVDQTAVVWDVEQGTAVCRPLRHASDVLFADFSPDSKRLVTASDDNSARLWDIASGELLVPPLKHDGTVVQALFSPNGRRVVTGSRDQTARVWDAATGQMLTPPLLHPWAVRKVRFSADGRQLHVTGPSGAIWAWDLPCATCPTEDMVQLAQLLAGSRIDEHRGIMPLTPQALKELWASLRQKRNDLFHFSDEDVTAWHQQVAEECRRGKHGDAALWHLDHLIQREPDHWLHYAHRGQVFAELGRWAEASDDFAQVVRRAPAEAEAWCLYAVLRLHVSDVKEYRRACAELVKQEPKGNPQRLAYVTAWTCVLSADADVKGSRLVELARQAAKSEPEDPDYLGTLGAAHFRAGDVDAAARHLHEALTLHGRRACPREWLWLALVEARKGSKQEARQWLDKAMPFLREPASDHVVTDATPLAWVQRLQLDLLRREVERTLK